MIDLMKCGLIADLFWANALMSTQSIDSTFIVMN